MAMEPTRVTFDAAALTTDQRDGLACVACGLDYMTGPAVPHIPVAVVDGGQVFVCVGCAPEEGDADEGDVPTPDEQDAAPSSVAVRLVKAIDQNADLSHKFADEDETDLASAFADVSLAWREVVAALGSDMGPAVAQVDAANVRARAALAAARARTSSDMGDAS